MKFKTNLRTSTSLIDMTPLVDVVFLMLIFFIVTSDILPLKSLNIQNPTLERDSAPLTTQLLIVMDAQNVIYLGSKKAIVDLLSLKSHLQEELDLLRKQHDGHEPTIVLSVDKRVEYGLFLKLFSRVQECCPNMRLVYQSDSQISEIED
jgi:biopolymer transport protein ExbD